MASFWHNNGLLLLPKMAKTQENVYISRFICLGKSILAMNIISYVIYQYYLKLWLYSLELSLNWRNCNDISKLFCTTTWIPDCAPSLPPPPAVSCSTPPLPLATTIPGNISSSSSSRTDRWVHFQQNAGLRLFVHTWIVHGIDNCYQLTRTFGGFSA